jgi:hypothetical protein
MEHPPTIHVENYLREHFGRVELQPQLIGDNDLFSFEIQTGEMRRLLVHRDNEAYCSAILEFLRKYDFAGQLERSNVEIASPTEQTARVNIGSIRR